MPQSSFTTMSAALWRPVQTGPAGGKAFTPPAPTPGAAGALYLAWDGARAIGSMVLNHDADPDYAQVPGWGPDADWPHLLLIHTLAVHPAYQGRGLARRLLAHAEVLARQSGMRALRLDVCVGNVPAIRLYEQCGFACAGTAEMHFCVGTVDPCRLYEKTL